VESNLTPFSSGFGKLAVLERLRLPLCDSCAARQDLLPSGLAGPPDCHSKTARDCLRLVRAGQAKSVRRSYGWCTSHAQLFHKQEFAARVKYPQFFRRIFAQNLSPPRNLAQALAAGAEENFSYFRNFLSGRSKMYSPKGSLPMISKSFSTTIVLASRRAPSAV
jgi:hypothetical protein